jgi:hypothetical protein
MVQGIEVSVHPNLLEGVPVEVLSGRSGDFQLEVWLDPKCNFAARRLTYTRSPDRVGFDEIAECDANVATFRQIDGHFFPATFRVEILRAGGTAKPPPKDAKLVFSPVQTLSQDRREIDDVMVKEIQINPAWSPSDFALRMKVPNGTKVSMHDAPQLNYVWQDGKVVPGLHAGAAAAAGNARFSATPPRSHRLGIIASIASITVLILVLALRFYRFRLAKRSGGTK